MEGGETMNVQQCKICHSHAVRYRNDYPRDDVRAYIVIHARGCSKLSTARQRWTPAKEAKQ